MITELQLVAAISARLKEQLAKAYPLYRHDWVVDFPGKPESITGDLVKVRHPKGLCSVRYMESVAPDTAETLITGVYIWATTPEMEARLSRAAKIALASYSPGGCSALALHKDEPVVSENGVSVRVVSFRCQVPSTRITDPAAELAALNL